MELAVGRVVKAHGVTGEVVVEVRTDDPEIRFVPGAALRARGAMIAGARLCHRHGSRSRGAPPDAVGRRC